MTATALTPATASTTSTASWDAQFQALKARYKGVKDSIVFAIHALQTNPEIAVEDLKAQAGMHGIRATAASVTAARRLLAPAPVAPEPSANGEPSATPARRKQRAAAAPANDTEVLIRQVVGRIQRESAEEAARLRRAMQQAIDILQAAVDA